MPLFQNRVFYALVTINFLKFSHLLLQTGRETGTLCDTIKIGFLIFLQIPIDFDFVDSEIFRCIIGV